MSHRIARAGTGFCRRGILLLLTLVCAIAGAAESGDRTAQRERFPLVWEAALHGPEGAWRALADGLETYPLFPYLELAALTRHIDRAEPAAVRKFLDAWPGSLPAQSLRDAWLLELARRGEWKTYLAFYDAAAHGRELQCDALKARIAQGEKPDFTQDIEPLWLASSTLPVACDDVFVWARKQGALDDAKIWQRIDLAAGAGNATLVSSLGAQLDAEDRAAAERIAQALRDPAAATKQADAWPDAPHSRQAAALALEKLARRDSDGADSAWNRLGTHFHFDTAQRYRVLRALALYPAVSFAPGALARLAALPDAAADDQTREWQVRSALAAQDWNAVLAAFDRLSATQKADARWRYIDARALSKLERTQDAEAVFAGVAREANFHGFLAADWLKQPYTICPTPPPAAPVHAPDDPSLTRAFEWYALGRLREARREWDFAYAQLDPSQRRAAAAAATAQGWYDRAVYGLNQGEDLHQYDLRFPIARRSQIERDAHAAGIDPSWAYAIIRAESAWTTDAHSGADAFGLMQLLPGTAKQLAKVEKLPFSGANDLYDPDLNIRLGTRYLADMALHYDGSPWLASAAYNAGADPVGRWIEARDALEPDFFIETIPYHETRDYVARVLAFSVIYDWRLHGDVQPLAARLPRIGQAYAPPAADAQRKAVVCESAQTVAAPVAPAAVAPAAVANSSPAPESKSAAALNAKPAAH